MRAAFTARLFFPILFRPDEPIAKNAREAYFTVFSVVDKNEEIEPNLI